MTHTYENADVNISENDKYNNTEIIAKIKAIWLIAKRVLYTFSLARNGSKMTVC